MEVGRLMQSTNKHCAFSTLFLAYAWSCHAVPNDTSKRQGFDAQVSRVLFREVQLHLNQPEATLTFRFAQLINDQVKAASQLKVNVHVRENNSCHLKAFYEKIRWRQITLWHYTSDWNRRFSDAIITSPEAPRLTGFALPKKIYSLSRIKQDIFGEQVFYCFIHVHLVKCIVTSLQRNQRCSSFHIDSAVSHTTKFDITKPLHQWFPTGEEFPIYSQVKYSL